MKRSKKEKVRMANGEAIHLIETLLVRSDKMYVYE